MSELRGVRGMGRFTNPLLRTAHPTVMRRYRTNVRSRRPFPRGGKLRCSGRVAAQRRHAIVGAFAGLAAATSLAGYGMRHGLFHRALAERYAQGEGLAVDIAEGMLRHARPQGGAAHFIAGDAEALPLQSDNVELLFSSLALQWCADFPRVLSEAQRVLRPGGVLAFSSLCVGTLQELRDSWLAVDGFVHVNRFRRFEDYQQLCAASGLQPLTLQRQAEVLHFADLRSLTTSLKELGAHNLNPGRPGGLTGRSRIRALIEAYECFRQAQGLPATYQVVYGVLQKPS